MANGNAIHFIQFADKIELSRVRSETGNYQSRIGIKWNQLENSWREGGQKFLKCWPKKIEEGDGKISKDKKAHKAGHGEGVEQRQKKERKNNQKSWRKKDQEAKVYLSILGNDAAIKLQFGEL